MAEDTELVEEKVPRNKNKKLRKGLVIGGITILGVIGLLALVYIGSILKLRANALDLTANVTADTFRQTETSIIYDINGKEITSLSGIKELYYVESKDIPEILKETFVLLEDQDFYKHSGIDLKSIIRASIANVSNTTIEQGASTITQQLAKNMFLTQDVTWSRKVTEMFVAFELEKKFSKDQILEFYINNIYFGNGYYGIEAAAEGYFGKKVGDLSLAELALLSGIPKNPSVYDPIADLTTAQERRDFILKQLYANGNISGYDYYEAIQEKIVLNIEEDNEYNYVETYVFNCATKALMEANGFIFQNTFDSTEEENSYHDLFDYYYTEYQTSLFTGGYRIYTSIDMSKQQLLQDIVDQNLKSFKETADNGIYSIQGAAVCIDNDTGFVTAIVGGRDQNFDGYTFNRGYQSYRQPGSSIKPLVVYAPYMMLGHTPDETVDDSPVTGGPENDNKVYRGTISLTEALGWSSNVVAWNLLGEMTPTYGMSFLHAMGFKKIAVDDDNQAVSIGGFTTGVSPVEMASGYATLENDGTYRTPTCIKRITDSKDDEIIDYRDRTGTEVYSPTSARMVTQMMEWGVNYGLLVNAQLDNAIVAAKSGTTDANKDGWIAGYSQYYTTVVWVGGDTPQTVKGLTGGSYPLAIWKEFMEKIHTGLEQKEFPSYTDVVTETATTTAPWETTTTVETTVDYGDNVLNIGDGDQSTNVDGLGDSDVNVDNMGDQDAQ